MFDSILSLQSSLENRDVRLDALLDFCKKNDLPFRWHPLGFIVNTLMNEGALKARLHIWKTDASKMQSNGECQIHDHIFEFKSWVIGGAVENIEYEISEAGQLYSLYQTEYDQESSVLTKTNRTIQLAIKSRQVIEAGSTYTVRAGQLHETRLAGSLNAVTVLLTKDVSSQPPTVVGPLDGLQKYEYLRSKLSERDIGKFLDNV